MQVFSTKKDLKNYLQEKADKKQTIGFVPTMGALHEGHISLLNHANAQCDVSVVSIFVNPAQFNDPKDFSNYPRTKETDLAKLKTANCTAVFYPESPKEVYPANFKDVEIDFGILEQVMEGAHRPGHFKGVANVVSCLFNIVNPTKAFFGLKDYQQFAVIKTLVKQKAYPLELVGVETKRAASGLALSSRNALLSTNDKTIAANIYQALQEAKTCLIESGVEKAYSKAEELLKSIPNFKLEYFCIAEQETLKPIEKDVNKANLMFPRAFVAGFLGNVRLIDNLSLNN